LPRAEAFMIAYCAEAAVPRAGAFIIAYRAEAALSHAGAFMPIMQRPPCLALGTSKLNLSLAVESK
jgi:hypothetical protein